MAEPRDSRLTHPERLRVGSAPQRDIAYRRRAGSGPGVVWLGGFRSDMLATKAEALDAWARDAGRAYLRFDYSGHGESGGRFEDGTISIWLEDALAAIGAASDGPQILVGSSMGGWLALLAARRFAAEGRPPAGLVLIAPATDFTQALMWPELGPEGQRAIETTGVYLRPSEYSPEPVPITRALIEDGRRHLLLGGAIRTHAPVHILQGMRDPDVPWRHAMVLTEHLAEDPVVVTLIKDGDHRLSRPQDLERLVAAVAGIA
ncbi:Alpha/beta hydrolase family protein [Beijerinckiaceae bacterium RH AL1]|nr:alpha/beta hydrolase [Beijerinckiaceae bacterium]VVB49825.1 Alpha/beta hydrolase family protein [Beijerinckiaceae bacterium RH CH11]VVB49902.1 Alpha/beta hydrolase family protein [Beijerinckiaceae bacterium RH AL8]VVC57095.1 Alpha/beta hydrolase family protein [Beijerinckiaceae bacterium RH AL1]